MNPFPRKLRRGRISAFTLIELLVVIFIIALLMGLSIWAIGVAITNAKKQSAMAQSKQIVSAVQQYITDYGKFADLPNAKAGTPENEYYSFGDGPAGGCRVNNEVLFDILRGNPRGANSDHVLNTRKFSYLTTKQATDPRHPRDGFADGSMFPDNIQGRLFDPWGGQYCVIIEADTDERLGLKEFYSDLGNSQNDMIRSSAVAFSMGKDGQRGGPGHLGKFRKSPSDPPEDPASW